MSPKKRILLLGGGHANLQVLQALANLDHSQFEVTLISDVTDSPYSGMLPSYLAGVYKADQLHFDLQKICRKFGYQFIQQRVEKINADRNQIRTSQGQIIPYDICSVNLGIQPMGISGEVEEQTDVIYLKPISKLIEKWDEIIQRTAGKMEAFDFTIVGGGAAAFEIAVACRRKFSALDHKVRIISGNHQLMQDQNQRTRKFAFQALEDLRIDLIEKVRVVKIEKEHLVLSDNRRILRQICLIATSAQASDIFRRSNLPVNAAGFVRVNADLRIEGFENIFAAGDCCHFNPKTLPKAGVFAVRQGPVLAANIAALIRGASKLSSYKPQRHFLKILVSGESRAIASYRSFAFEGFLAWKLKNWIDLRFMKRFQ